MLSGEPTYGRLVRGEILLRRDPSIPSGGFNASGHTLSRHKIVAGPDLKNGRGLTIAGTDPIKPLSGVTVQDCMIQGDGDDALSVSGNCRRIKITGTRVMGLYQWPNPLDFTKVNKCVLLEGPYYYSDWLTILDSSFAGGFRCPLVTGGVFRFERCEFGPSRRNVWTAAQGDIVDCHFTVQIGMKVAGGPNPWSDSQDVFVRPICLADQKSDSLYFSGNTLTVLDASGKVIRSGPASGPELCRLYPSDGSSPVGLDDDVKGDVFRTTPNRG